jgi:ParB family chromosome partitioning protein
MVIKRNPLGRGLGALIPPVPALARADGAEAPAPLAAPNELPVDAIAPNPDQPRRVFGETELASLADSIRRHGVLQPIVVREAPAGAPHRYEIVVGERRWRAARRAGLATIPATIQNVDSRALLEVALVENIQRADLNAIELAQAFRTLTTAGFTQEEIGARVGLERSTIANHLRLLDLPRSMQEDVETGRMSMGHAKALLSIASPERRLHLRDRIVADGLSVRAAESLARTLGSAVAPARRDRGAKAPPAAPELAHLVDRLRDRLQTRVRIETQGERGTLAIDFYGAEDLTRIASAILEGPGL